MASNFDYRWSSAQQKTKITFKNSSEPTVTIKLTADGGTAKPYDTAKNAGNWEASVPDADVKGKQFKVGAYGDADKELETDTVFFFIAGGQKTTIKVQKESGSEIAVDEPAGSTSTDKPSKSYRFKTSAGNKNLTFTLDSGKTLSEYSVDDARNIVVDMMSQCVGLHADIGTADSKVRDAYCDLLNLWDDIPHTRWAPDDHSSSASSCGLFIRSMWRLLGIRHSKLGDPCYENIPIPFAQKVGATKDFSSWKNPKDKSKGDTPDLPKKGDVIYIYDGTVKSPNHIFTLAQDAVLENGKITTVSIDGGQSRSAQDAPSLGIWPRKRHLNRDTLIFDEDPDGNKRKVASWVSFEKLLPLFKAKMIRLKRTDTITDDMKTPRGSGAA